MNQEDVDTAVTEMLRVLGSQTAKDWTALAGPLDWTCWQTAAHIGHDLAAYAGQLTAQPTDAYLPFDLKVRPTASPAELLQVVLACGGLLSSALVTASPARRAWHWGLCAPEGFAAMGVGEILLHTHDITQGLSVDWLPPAPLSQSVLDRLFPSAPSGEPAQVLLWCTGRARLDGHPRQTSWRWEPTRSG